MPSRVAAESAGIASNYGERRPQLPRCAGHFASGTSALPHALRDALSSAGGIPRDMMATARTCARALLATGACSDHGQQTPFESVATVRSADISCHDTTIVPAHAAL